ncbi:hypothetical protein BH11MYX1_BH11MYX1_43650 [soil metagenome]
MDVTGIWQEAPPGQTPPHAVNSDPAVASPVSVTVVPAGKSAVHAPGAVDPGHVRGDTAGAVADYEQLAIDEPRGHRLAGGNDQITCSPPRHSRASMNSLSSKPLSLAMAVNASRS